jgi:mono/diheme cytochrome c family protein
MRKLTALLIVVLAVPMSATLASCRGEISERPPIHLVPNMDWQDRLDAQSKSDFPGWKDGRGMRRPVEHTIRKGGLRLHSDETVTVFGQKIPVAALHTYKDEANTGTVYATKNPVKATAEVLARGRERYDINCAVCHGQNGRGKGIVGIRLGVPPPTFLEKGNPPETPKKKDLFAYTNGQFFEIITNGFSTMPSYAPQVTAEDRWAIIHYIRALQYRASH